MVAIEEENMANDSKELDEIYKKWDEEGRQDLKVEGNTKKQAVESITVESCLELSPHEKVTIDGLLTVAKGILKDLKFTWPVFVDKKSRVVLDGMHRFKLLKDCCFKRIPVQLIEYNDDIKLDTWCRHIKGIKKDCSGTCRVCYYRFY